MYVVSPARPIRSYHQKTQKQAYCACLKQPKKKGSHPHRRASLPDRSVLDSSWQLRAYNRMLVPSTFEENLSLSEFEDIHEYPVSTAMHKAVEIYERMVVCLHHQLGARPRD